MASSTMGGERRSQPVTPQEGPGPPVGGWGVGCMWGAWVGGGAGPGRGGRGAGGPPLGWWKGEDVAPFRCAPSTQRGAVKRTQGRDAHAQGRGQGGGSGGRVWGAAGRGGACGKGPPQHTQECGREGERTRASECEEGAAPPKRRGAHGPPAAHDKAQGAVCTARRGGGLWGGWRGGSRGTNHKQNDTRKQKQACVVNGPRRGGGRRTENVGRATSRADQCGPPGGKRGGWHSHPPRGHKVDRKAKGERGIGRKDTHVCNKNKKRGGVANQNARAASSGGPVTCQPWPPQDSAWKRREQRSWVWAVC